MCRWPILDGLNGLRDTTASTSLQTVMLTTLKAMILMFAVEGSEWQINDFHFLTTFIWNTLNTKALGLLHKPETELWAPSGPQVEHPAALSVWTQTGQKKRTAEPQNIVSLLTVDVSQRKLVSQLRQCRVHVVYRGDVLPTVHPVRQRFTSPAVTGGLHEKRPA